MHQKSIHLFYQRRNFLIIRVSIEVFPIALNGDAPAQSIGVFDGSLDGDRLPIGGPSANSPSSVAAIFMVSVHYCIVNFLEYSTVNGCESSLGFTGGKIFTRIDLDVKSTLLIMDTMIWKELTLQSLYLTTANGFQ